MEVEGNREVVGEGIRWRWRQGTFVSRRRMTRRPEAVVGRWPRDESKGQSHSAHGFGIQSNQMQT